MEKFILIVFLIFTGAVFYFARKRNAWDLLFFNTTLGILALFLIGILLNDKEIWLRVISFLGIVATGSAFASAFFRSKKDKGE